MWAFPDTSEFAADVQRVFDELQRALPAVGSTATGLIRPPLDIVETPAALDVLVDLPGVPPDAIRVVFNHSLLIIAGDTCCLDTGDLDTRRFHHVERSYGRFARVVRFSEAIDASRATASLTDGVLRISVPRIDERRGRDINVPVRPGRS